MDDDCGCPSCPATEQDDGGLLDEDRLLSCSGTSLIVKSSIVKIIPAEGTPVLLGPTQQRRLREIRNQVVPRSDAPRPDVPDS
jgi:hypothetical protein